MLCGGIKRPSIFAIFSQQEGEVREVARGEIAVSEREIGGSSDLTAQAEHPGLCSGSIGRKQREPCGLSR